MTEIVNKTLNFRRNKLPCRQTACIGRGCGWNLDRRIEPQYAGYVGYRGLVDKSDLDAKTAAILTERFVFYQFLNSHILQYVIPGEDEFLVPGEQRFNWVWYVNYDEATELLNC